MKCDGRETERKVTEILTIVKLLIFSKCFSKKKRKGLTEHNKTLLPKVMKGVTLVEILKLGFTNFS